MAEALKDRFGPDVPARIGAMLAEVDPTFPVDALLAEALDGYEGLELTPRARRIAEVLGRLLPPRFEDAASLVEASLGPPIDGDELTGLGMEPFVYLPYVYWVADRGLGHWAAAMDLQHALTQRFSCEFSIRAFIEAVPERTLARLRSWTDDPSPHVRRLVSEGTRPRLPWAPRLRRFVEDPSPVIELLELLKDDPTTLVRRSVANNLNDIGKDHPDVLVEVCGRWLDDPDVGDERRALVRHALRSARKRGDAGALALLGFGEVPTVEVVDVEFDPPIASLGERIRIVCRLVNGGDAPVSLNVDLRVHFVKANGATSPKVFTLGTVAINAGDGTTVAKSVSLAQHSTRRHHPGDHAIELLVNGVPHSLGSFPVVPAG